MANSLLKHIKLVVVWAIFFSILAGGISFLLPKKYSADSQVLIISRDRTGVDPYTQAKSTERIGENLAQVMKTGDFYKKVMDSTSYSFDRAKWTKLDDRAQRKKWNKDVLSSVVYGT